MASYPTSIVNLTPKVLNDVLLITDVNNLQDEVEAIETELGVAPSGAYSTTVQRLDNLVNENLLINGDMSICQEWGYSLTNGNVANGEYLTDIFIYRKTNSTTVDFTHLTYTFSTVGNSNKAIALTLTALTATAAGDYHVISTFIPGNKIGRHAAASTDDYTLQFTIRAEDSGTMCISFRNAAATMNYIAEVSITASTDQLKTITLKMPGAGTWESANSIGMMISWCLAAGATYHTGAGGWTTTAAFASTNQSNWFSDSFYLSNVKFERGMIATEFVPPDPAKNIIDCQHYYEVSYDRDDAVGQA